MKIIRSKLVSPTTESRGAEYIVLLKLSDDDVCKLEDLATCYCTYGTTSDCNFRPHYRRWLIRTFKMFTKLWRKYDTFDTDLQTNREMKRTMPIHKHRYKIHGR